MNNLFVFGCSLSATYENNRIGNYTEYEKFKGGKFPPSWSDILAEKLGYNLINCAKGGCSNQTILRTFSEKADKIKKGDMIIFQWTAIERFDWAEEDKFRTMIHSSFGTEINVDHKTIEDIIINRMSKPYSKELYSFMNFINAYIDSIGAKIYFWSMNMDDTNRNSDIFEKYGDKILLNNIINKNNLIQFYALIELIGGQTIRQETNNLIDDGHLAESGHKIQAELFYNHIINPNLNLKYNDVIGLVS